MIEELRIADLGVISEATLSLDRGLTVVTGETGAGKTMIVTGIGLLLGDRADPRSVRRGAERARVEGRFRLASAPLSARVQTLGAALDDDELLIARHVTGSGRSRAYLGGAQVPATVCAEITGELIAVHGQSEQVRLGASDRQREILDTYAGKSVLDPLRRYMQRFGERQAAAVELKRLRSEAQNRAREVDLLTFGLAEVERVAPQPGEDHDLAAEAARLQSADDLRAVASTALGALAGADDEAGGALAAVSVARRALAQARGPAGEDSELGQLAGRLEEASYQLTDLASDLARFLESLDAEPARLEWIAGRRAALAGLTRKYGATVAEVLAWATEAARRLEELGGTDDRIDTLDAQVAALTQELSELASTISAGRRAAARTFVDEVVQELAALAMPHARLAFELSEVELGPTGADRVDLLFSANPGSEPRSLSKVASGGELSRVRLALEVVLAASRTPATLVFDEVDAGVGGRVAVEIGRRLAVLARNTQVLVVTHLAQVAAFADRHFLVVKSEDGQVTTSGVLEVSEDRRTAELARMMAGLETTESALAHAGELVEMASAARGRSS